MQFSIIEKNIEIKRTTAAVSNQKYAKVFSNVRG